jgi:transcriptional regulator with XRE-family HTH domain
MMLTEDPVSQSNEPVGRLLREWRKRRNLTQSELAIQTELSTRHLSFVETGRSQPSRSVVLRLCDELDLPLRERNEFFLAAGYAPPFSESPIASKQLAPALTALRATLEALSPNPAVLIDRRWNLIDANPTISLLIADVAAELLEPPVNVLKLTLDPRGMAPRIPNYLEWREHLTHRLHRQVLSSGDPELAQLEREIEELPFIAGGTVRHPSGSDVVVPLLFRARDRVLSFISTTMVLGAPIDITADELALECFYPADSATAEYLARG